MSFAMAHLFVIFMVLIAVAYFTLFERKVLAAAQMRKGPNKAGIAGLAQPLADAVKLFTNETTRVQASNEGSYWLAPTLGLIIALTTWELAPYKSAMINFKWGAILFLCGSSLAVYPIILAGWASNSKYSLLGAMRAIAQTISYEVCLGLILFNSAMLSSSLSFVEISAPLKISWSALMFPPLFGMWLSCLLAETNRTPFDFAEGESELVSGFNVEYGSVGFSLIFMAEYANILFMSMITSVTFLGGGSSLMMATKTLLVCYFVIWARATLPRFRYDLLMYLTWKKFLPLVLSLLMLILSILFLMQSAFY
uniref:NADH dehydrogenase subunit 1 n=1 Tax=Lottia goshimai TaxID=1824450 RepID=UPI002114A44F|nr:NADH dehydrogenase subunit 1 [Lottia goshimai]UTM92218.1 NADH dehydrogenase subunit 1 [Lottia peitaihoensis]